MSEYLSGFVSIVGLPNSGKSTLLNTISNTKLASISPRPQTTRFHLKSIITTEKYQIIFIDTPGFLKPRNTLEKIMENEYKRAIKDDADIIIILIEPDVKKFKEKKEYFLNISKIKKDIIIAINKIDTYPKNEVENIKSEIRNIFLDYPIIEISALKNIGIEELKNSIIEKLPSSPPYYYDDILSDKWERYFASEIIMEEIFNNYHDEIPYSTIVGIQYFKENLNPIEILAYIYVSRPSHKPIIIGEKGRAIKKLRENSEKKISDLLGKEIKLELFVTIKKNWQNDPVFLNEIIGHYK